MKGRKYGSTIGILAAALALFAFLQTQACGGSASDKAPDQVEGVLAIAGDGQNIIMWNLAKNAASYNLYWDVQPGVSTARMDYRVGTKVEKIKATAYLHTGLTNGTTYYYIVTAVSEGGKESPTSVNEASATPKAAINCPSTQRLCQDKCVNVQTDRTNCGSCGKVCGATENCTAGACVSG